MKLLVAGLRWNQKLVQYYYVHVGVCCVVD